MIILAASIESIKTRRDKTVSITIGTQELTPEKGGELFSLNGKLGFVAIKTANFDDSESDTIEKLDTNIDAIGKSPSQRLRNVLFLNFKENSEGYNDFNLYYHFKLEKLIEHFKNKIQNP